MCRQVFHPKRELTPEQRVRQLDEEHYVYLLDPRTLERWAGKTLAERCRLFHRRFTNKRIAVTTLRRFYLKHGLRRKKVRQEKYMPANHRANYQRKCRETL